MIEQINPTFIDFEASSASGWPIEVGWARVVDQEIIVESHLIRPEPEWSDAEWDEVSAEVHGITLRELQLNGKPASLVADRVVKVLSGCLLISDAGHSDTVWLNRLMEAHGENREWLVTDLQSLRRQIRVGAWNCLAAELLAQPATHRAGDDAGRLAHAWLVALQWNKEI